MMRITLRSLILLIALATGSFASALMPAEKAKKLIETIYLDRSGFVIDQTEYEAISKAGGAPTYGEITFDAVATLVKKLAIDEDDVFYDLGCGAGKVNIQIYLTTAVHRCVGVEMSKARIRHAKDAKVVLKKRQLLDAKRKLDFHCGDMMKADLKDATIIYICSTCFSVDMMKKLVTKFATLKPGLRVITLKPLPDHPRFKLVQNLLLPMTWMEGVGVRIYKLQA